MENSNHRLSPLERAQAWTSSVTFIDKGVSLQPGDFLEGAVITRKNRQITSMSGGTFTLIDLLVKAARARQYGVACDTGTFFTISVFPSSEVGSLNPLEGDLLAVIFQGQREYKKKDGTVQSADVYTAELDRSPENEALLQKASEHKVPTAMDDEIPF
jgi:hypothetical protein